MRREKSTGLIFFKLDFILSYLKMKFPTIDQFIAIIRRKFQMITMSVNTYLSFTQKFHVIRVIPAPDFIRNTAVTVTLGLPVKHLQIQ